MISGKASFSRNCTVASLIFVIGVSGCATIKKYDGTTEESGGCNAAVAAGVGALLGALIGGRNNLGSGAAVGAAIGGLSCLAWNYKAQQTKTAQQVNEAYRAKTGAGLPARAQIVKYEVKSAPSSVVNAGNPIIIDSTIEIVGASSGNPPVVEQQLMVMHDGKVISKTTKRANGGQGAGEYMTSFTLKMPMGVPQGQYPVITALFLDGAKVREQNIAVQVVMSGDGDAVAMLVEEASLGMPQIWIKTQK